MTDDYRYTDAYDYVKRGIHGKFYRALDRWTIRGLHMDSTFTVADRAAGVGDAEGWRIVYGYHRDLCPPIQRWLEQERHHENV